MRIAFDYQIFALQACGGISRYVTRLAEHLCKIGEEVRIFSPLHCNEYLASLHEPLRNGHRICRTASKAMRLTLPYNHLVCQRKVSAWEADIVHETYFSAFNAKSKKPTVLTVYDMVHERYPAEFSRLNRLSDHKRKAVQRADHVICISESTRRDLHAFVDVPSDKVSVVHLGFDSFSNCLPLRSSVTEGRRPYLLFVGNRQGYKNFTGLLRAIAQSGQLFPTFDLVAFGGGRFTNEEQTLIRSLGYHSSQVRHAGGSDVDLAKLYQDAAALIYPSFYEGFGLPPLEAMAHNCAVVVSNTSSIPEVVGDAGEYFDPTSVCDIAAAIERVVLSPERALALVRRGHERLTHFSWEACARETLSVYKKLLG
ncbi:glycosyltransferase family 4 protein [Parapusillimonas sp. SGNA-6]|nr:glycosyltransferase family 4 protein [Parapusillimonas sp. SGNA-6]